MRRLFLVSAALLAAAYLAAPAQPCSRVLWNDNGRSVLVGRHKDWFENQKYNLLVLPPGAKRDRLAPKNPHTRTSN